MRFDDISKRKVLHHTRQIRMLVEKLDGITPRKKSKLLERLTDFEAELQRPRTRYESFAALIVDLAALTGEATEHLEPVRKWIDSIAALIWGSKQTEPQRLPAPEERKRLEAPKKQLPPRKNTSLAEELDNDIPF